MMSEGMCGEMDDLHLHLADAIIQSHLQRFMQGHLHTQLGGGAGDPTSNLRVTGQPALPPELLTAS